MEGVESYPTSQVLTLNKNSQKPYTSSSIFLNGEVQSHSQMQNEWELGQDSHLFNEEQSSVGLQKQAMTVEDSKTHHKEKDLGGESSFEISPELEFIKSPVRYGDKEEDFMSTDNLMKSFQPAYHHYLF